MSSRKATLTQLQSIWYRKLKESGFEDIENHGFQYRDDTIIAPKVSIDSRGHERARMSHDWIDSNLPLKIWHSRWFKSNEQTLTRKNRAIYQEKIDTFANCDDFLEIVNHIVKHGNSIFTSEQVILIWDMHRDGYTERRTAKEMQCSKSCIHFLLHRIKTWMTLVV